MRFLPSLIGAPVLVLLAAWAAPLRAEVPLHQRIDQLIAAGKPDFEKHAAPVSTDAEFLRRITLDLTGTIPSAAEARAFLNDTAADKRAQLIDRLLASPEYARHMQNVFDVLLLERRPDKHVPRADWQTYLRTSFAANKPWDQLVREVLSADGADPKARPAAKFSLDRDGEPNTLTRDIGRLFLGMNLTCAQCHDHPIVPDYKQDHYYGLFAFYNRSFVFNPKSRNQAVLAEKADGEVSFQSVFDPKKISKTTAPRMPDGPPLKEPAFAKGKEYEVAPANNVRPIPKFSRRAQLAALLATSENEQFKRSSANRMWALLMGRGLIHPLDMDHSSNPPSHPELLDLLAEEFAGHKFDIKAMLREVTLSKTYQRSSELPPGGKDMRADAFATAQLKPLSAEQLAFAMMQATGLTDGERKVLGAKLTEETLHARLAVNLPVFVAIFGGQPGQPDAGFQITLDQTLFLSNGPQLRAWLGNLTDRLRRLADADAVAEELYLSVLTRRPSAEERKEVADYLKERKADAPAALLDLAWALLASAEFRFNH